MTEVTVDTHLDAVIIKLVERKNHMLNPGEKELVGQVVVTRKEMSDNDPERLAAMIGDKFRDLAVSFHTMDVEGG